MYSFFFYDILVYSSTIEKNWLHLHQVFDLMQLNKMYAKPSKCVFAISKIEYLGNFMSANGLETDPKKIAVWQIGQLLEQLRN